MVYTIHWSFWKVQQSDKDTVEFTLELEHYYWSHIRAKTERYLDYSLRLEDKISDDRIGECQRVVLLDHKSNIMNLDNTITMYQNSTSIT